MNFHSNFDSINVSAVSPDFRLLHPPAHKKSYFKIKRALDLMLVIPAFIILSPIMLIVMYLIRKHDGGFPFFVQTRIGLNGREFNCYKFRTMVVDAQKRLDAVLKSDPIAAAEWEKDQKLKNDPRITKVGQFLRKTSLDELPQLWNIIKGEMSLVGPRPIIENEIPKYGSFFKYYSSVKPGISGLWQINGRNNTTYDERVQYDVTYAKTYSFLNDTKILLKTLPAVLLSKGAY